VSIGCPYIREHRNIPIMTVDSVMEEKQDSLMTAIIPVQVTPDDVVEVTPLRSAPTIIESIFVNAIEDWV